MELLDKLRSIVGSSHVLTEADAAGYGRDWTGKYVAMPLAVVRPANTEQVSRVMAAAYLRGVAMVPVSGNTGLSGGALAEGQLMISLERLRTVRKFTSKSRLMIAEAGVVLDTIHQSADKHDLVFPVTFGARGSCMLGGILATNAGGSNVVRYGNARDQILGIEVVLPDGTILDLMSELHKDNSGYDLRDLFIGSEGTLGVITAAVLKLAPKPRAYATAMVALPSLAPALDLLNRLQETTGGAVEAFEYMPRAYIDQHLKHAPQAREPFSARYDVNVMVEIAASSPRDCEPNADGTLPLVELLQGTLMDMVETGAILDAVIAKNEAERKEMWHRRELAGEIISAHNPAVLTDVSLPLDQVAPFLDEVNNRIAPIDPKGIDITVAHLGDGNVHYSVWTTLKDPADWDRIMEAVEILVVELGGSFSAEHGIGVSKIGSMKRRKDPVALRVMGQIKSALDPKGLMNPGKLLPR